MGITRKQFLKYGAFTIASGVLIDAFWVEKYFIAIKTFYVGDANKDNINIKILQISDLHIQKLSGALITLAAKINKLQPDIIAFTGDAIDKADNLKILESFLALLNVNIQKVAILGNWEYWGKVNINLLKELYAKYNGKLLINESILFTINNQTITISGVDDYLGGSPNILKTIENINESNYHIILNHCLAYTDVTRTLLPKKNNVNFILSGHTHGGQVNFFGWAPMLPLGSNNYVSGWYKNALPHMYVSKGIGTSVLPIRFGSRAEVALFNL